MQSIPLALTVTVRSDFYHKVILPSVPYGLVVWESWNKITLIELYMFSNLERIHVRATKIIYRGVIDVRYSKSLAQTVNWRPLWPPTYPALERVSKYNLRIQFCFETR